MLTDRAIKLANAADRPYKLTDGRGLSLLVQLNGSKLWRYRYRFQRLEKMLSLGIYPTSPLPSPANVATKRAGSWLVARGVDPSAERKAERLGAADSFESVARGWMVAFNRHVHDRKRSINTYNKAEWMLETFSFNNRAEIRGRPASGNLPIWRSSDHPLRAAADAASVRALRGAEAGSMGADQFAVEAGQLERPAASSIEVRCEERPRKA